MKEIWSSIPEFTEYEISDRWRIRKKVCGTLIKTSTNNNGCDFVVLRKAGKGYSRSLNKLVRTAF